MKVTVLRRNIYSVLDKVINSGKNVHIERHDGIVKLMSDK